MKIGNQKFVNYKISTKIHFGKKQFVWELSDLGSPVKGESEENKAICKRKFESRFMEIDKIDINLDSNTLTLGDQYFY